jgi:two-component system alkaline phosphatase synthesis response regulator PhoP
MNGKTVLVIDDERDLVALVRYNLEREGFEVLGALDGVSGLELAVTRKPDVIILDRMMPGPDGVEICRRLRQEVRTAEVPVILLTAKTSEGDRIAGLDAGADDYVTKPFSPKELVARVRARLRRPVPLEGVPSVVRNGDLLIDDDQREVTFAGRPVAMTPSEFRILRLLAASPGRVMFRRSSAQGELLLGSLAVRLKVVTTTQLRDALSLQDRNPSRKLGEILFERMNLAQKDLDRLLEHQRQAFGESDDSPSGLLGRILVHKTLASEFQVNEALRIQGRLVEAGLRPIPPLGTILMKRGHLTRDALATALEVQNFMLYRCTECESRIGISPGSRGGVPVCPACKQEVPPLFSKMASAIHHVLEEAAGKHAFELPDEVVLAAEKPNRDFGKYLLVRLVGRGGAGEVWRAWQKDAGRIVALKILPRHPGPAPGPKTPFGEPEAVKRFFMEARAIADLSHPNIVPLLDYGTAEDSFYCGLRFIEGVSLETLLRGRLSEEDLRGARIPLRSGVDPAPDEISPSAPARKLPLRFCLEIVRDVALALDHAHGRGVVHRDVKPGNILVDRDGKPWLIDFGLARIARLGDPAYERGIVVGTPFYMPPEQAAGDMEMVDASSDIYSLGAVLYELSSGLYPFTGRSEDTVFDLVKVQGPLPVESLASDAPPEVLSVIRRAMARSKNDRFPTARALAEAVDQCLIHVPTGTGE